MATATAGSSAPPQQASPEWGLYFRSVAHASAVTHVIVARLINPMSSGVVLVRENVLEINTVDESGALCTVAQQPLFDTVRAIRKLPWAGEYRNDLGHRQYAGLDLLAVLSVSGKLVLVGYNSEKSRFENLSTITLSNGHNRTSAGNSLAVHAGGCAMAVASVQHTLRVYSVRPSDDADAIVAAEAKTTVNGVVLCMEWCGPIIDEVATLCVLYHPSHEAARTLGVLRYDMVSNTIEWTHGVPCSIDVYSIVPTTGLFGDCCILLHERGAYMYQLSVAGVMFTGEVTCSTEPLLMTSSAQLGEDRILVATEMGSLNMFSCGPGPNGRRSLVCAEVIGKGTLPSTSSMAILNDRHVVMAGDLCDGGVFEIIPSEAVPFSLEHRTSIPNFSPARDFVIANAGDGQQEQLFMCTGQEESGCVRALRSGMGVAKLGSTSPDYVGVTGVWTVKQNSGDTYHSVMVLSFVNATRVLSASNDMQDISDDSGFVLDRRTLYVGTAVHGYIAQVLDTGIWLVRPSSGRTESQNMRWSPPEECRISACAVLGSRIVVCLSKMKAVLVLSIVHNNVTGGVDVVEVDHVAVQHEGCCIDIPSSGLGTPTAAEDSRLWGGASDGRTLSDVCVVGTYGATLEILQLPSPSESDSAKKKITRLETVQLGQIVDKGPIPESMRMVFCDKIYVVVGLRNGSVITMSWPLGAFGAAVRPQYQAYVHRLGTAPIQLIPRQSSVDCGVLALSDRPWLVSPAKNRLLFTCISFPLVSHASCFICEDCPDGFIFVADQSIHVVTLDQTRNLSEQSIPLHKTPVRVLFHEGIQKLVVACVLPNKSSVIEIVDTTYGTVCGSFTLTNQKAYSITRWHPIGDDFDVICVGCQMESGQMTGRLHLITISEASDNFVMTDVDTNENQLQDIYEMRAICDVPLRHPVYAMTTYQTKFLMVSSGERLHVYAKDSLGQPDASWRPREACKHFTRGCITSISAGLSRVVVGTRNDSILFYAFREDEEKLELLHSDRAARLVQDCLVLDDEVAIGLEIRGGIFTLVCDGSEANSQSPERNLVSHSFYELGESALRVRRGRLSYKDAASPDIPTVVLCTVLGSIIVAAMLPKNELQLLRAVQSVMANHPETKPLLGAPHELYRSNTDTAKNSIDGDLTSQYLDLSATQAEEIAALVSQKPGVGRVTSQVITLILEKLNDLAG